MFACQTTVDFRIYLLLSLPTIYLSMGKSLPSVHSNRKKEFPNSMILICFIWFFLYYFFFVFCFVIRSFIIAWLVIHLFMWCNSMYSMVYCVQLFCFSFFEAFLVSRDGLRRWNFHKQKHAIVWSDFELYCLPDFCRISMPKRRVIIRREN